MNLGAIRAWVPHLAGVAVLCFLVALLVSSGVDPRVLPGLKGLGAVMLWALAATGLGGALLGKARAGPAMALGIGVLGLVLLLLATLGMLSGWMLGGVALAASCGWILKPQLEIDLDPAVLWVLVPVAALGLGVALAPPIDTDEIYQHLALPKLMLNTGGLVGGMLTPDGSRPVPLHMSYTALLAFGGSAGPKLFHLGAALLLLAEVHRLGERLATRAGWGALAVLVGSYTVLRELGLADNNLPAALMCLYALRAQLDDAPWRMALFSGIALSIKYTAAPVVFGLYLCDLIQRRDLKRSALTTCLALGLVAPWWTRNLLEGLHPLFPYAGWPAGDRFVFAYIERYGMGRDALSMLMLPWNATLHGDPTKYQGFLGRMSPLGLAAVPGMALAAWKARERPAFAVVLGTAACAWLGWTLGAHWLRYLLPAAPLLALAVGLGISQLPKWGQALALGVGVIGLPSNLRPVLEQALPLAQVSFGSSTTQELLEEEVPGYSAIQWVNEEAPVDARIALTFAWAGYYLDKPYLLGSVEDHVPMRHLLYLHGPETVEVLRQLGVTHVVSGRVRFIHKTYPFLSDAVFREQFTDPEALWEALLLENATLVYRDGRYGVWRL
ncbi:MAG: hypothetical protein ACI9VR_000081 [Cognaticolwellia sp.]|jgi:hypothetical protein